MPSANLQCTTLHSVIGQRGSHLPYKQVLSSGQKNINTTSNESYLSLFEMGTYTPDITDIYLSHTFILPVNLFYCRAHTGERWSKYITTDWNLHHPVNGSCVCVCVWESEHILNTLIPHLTTHMSVVNHLYNNFALHVCFIATDLWIITDEKVLVDCILTASQFVWCMRK